MVWFPVKLIAQCKQKLGAQNEPHRHTTPVMFDGYLRHFA
jgi:hypothetical protein